MATPVTLPELGESVTEGTVTRWLKQVGDSVAVDEPLLEISTDKVDTEIPSPVGGTLLEIKAQEDETVEVGAELASIGDEGEQASSSAGGDQAETAQPEQPAQSESQQRPQADATQAEEPAQGQQPEPAAQAQDYGSAQGGGSSEGTPVTLPELGESVTEGTVTRWLKQVGDSVAVDEPLLEISTDKVDTEIPSPVEGTLLEIKAQEDETIEVGAELAVVGSGQAEQPQAQQQPQQQEQREQPQQQPQPQAQAQPQPQQQEQPEQPQRQQQPERAPAPAAETAPAPRPQSPPVSSEKGAYVTPIVRKLATKHGVALDSVEGTGVGGRIRKQDVLDAAEKQQAPAAPEPATSAPAASDTPGLRGTVKKASRIRQLTAVKTKESLAISPQCTQVHEVDVTKIARLRERAKSAFAQREGVKLTFLPFFAKAAVEALKQHPNVNASYNEDTTEITYHGDINLGIAVDTEKGLLTVVVHDAGELSLSGLAHRIADLAARARSNEIRPDELTGGTFTITNLGSNGALFDTPILVQPQAGMLGIGTVIKRPVVIADPDGNDTIAVRSMAHLPLSYDHRLIDGADAGRFLTTIKQRLEEGSFESDLG